MNEALAVILGRAGSKGLPGKNSRRLAGRPVIEHTLQHAAAAATVTRMVVSTDGDEIAAAAEAAGAAIVRRPAHLASDTAPVCAAVRHAVMEAQGAEPVIVVLYANVPVRPADLIDRAVRCMEETGADSVQSYTGVGKHHPAWMVALDDAHRVCPLTDSTVDRRQDLPALLIPDGGVIAVRRDVLLASRDDPPHEFLGCDRRGIETAPGTVVDIDTEYDLRVAECLLAAEVAPNTPVKIGARQIAIGQPPCIIAELGVNHDGSPARALELVDAAAAAGADAVKVQWFEAERLLGRAARLAEYQRAAGADDPVTMLERLQLDSGSIAAVVRRTHERGLLAIATLFSIEHVVEAAALAFDAFKTASPDVVNRPLLEALCGTGRPLLVSTGAADRAEVAAAIGWLGSHPHILMHCVSAYPVPDESAGLAGRLAMLQLSPCALGYSDHTTALDTGALAVASGACVLEKHLTHDRTADGPDHAASLGPVQFGEYVRLARRAHTMLGEQVKRVQPIEQDVRSASRQSLTARRDLPAGHVLAAEELAIKRPGTGLEPWRFTETVGRRLARPVQADMPLTEGDLA